MSDDSPRRDDPAMDDDTVHVHFEDDEDEDCGASARGRAEEAVEHLRSVVREMADGLLRQVPPDVVEHVNNSRKELLLAFRGLIDHELDRVDRCTRHARDLHEGRDDETEAKDKA